METMRSPEEPIFFLHHGNIERLHTIFQDCWDYEFTEPSQLTSKNYNASNPNPWPYPFSASYYKRDLLGNIINVGIDAVMAYWWKAYMIGSNKFYTYVDAPWMKNGTWPTPRQAYFVGYPEEPYKGWQNLTYTYGNDDLVNTLGSSCTSNTRWTYFPNAPSSAVGKKRAVNEKYEVAEISEILANTPATNNSNKINVYTRLIQRISDMRKKGLCQDDAIESLAMQECLETPPQTFPPTMKAWMEMNGLQYNQFDRICEDIDPNDLDNEGVLYSYVVEVDGRYYTPVNSLAVIGYCIGGFVLLVFIIVGIVILRRKERNDESNYLNL
jgi:hypothetical protein